MEDASSNRWQQQAYLTCLRHLSKFKAVSSYCIDLSTVRRIRQVSSHPTEGDVQFHPQLYCVPLLGRIVARIVNTAETISNKQTMAACSPQKCFAAAVFVMTATEQHEYYYRLEA